MAIEFMDYQDAGEVLEAAVAFPAGQDCAPAVLVVHQWAGQGEGEHRAAERLAGLGYVGIAIDLYGKGVRGDPAGDNSRLMIPLVSDRARLLARLKAALAFARGFDRVETSAVAAIGYCFGGLCVLDLARSGADGVAGVVSLHGTLEGHDLEPEGPMKAKVLVEHGWLDPLAPPDKVLAFAEEMQTRGADWRLHVHGRTMHAFTEPHAQKPEYGMAYNADADRRSWASTTAFLSEVLKLL